MKWISEKHESRPSLIEGVEPMSGYVVEGWLIETDDDKNNFILCKKCRNKIPIKECKKEPCKVWNDVVVAPVWELECPYCFHLVGKLEEQTIYTRKVLSQYIVSGRVVKDFEKKTRLLLEIYNERAEIILK